MVPILVTVNQNSRSPLVCRTYHVRVTSNVHVLPEAGPVGESPTTYSAVGGALLQCLVTEALGSTVTVGDCDTASRAVSNMFAPQAIFPMFLRVNQNSRSPPTRWTYQLRSVVNWQGVVALAPRGERPTLYAVLSG